jgi:choline dehydrogenase-like flavoprotein
MAEKLEYLVIGGGVIGIAIARRLALAGLEVLVLEAESAVARTPAVAILKSFTPASITRPIR